MSRVIRHIVITGGTGFVGSNLIERLLNGAPGAPHGLGEVRLVSVLSRDTDAALNQFSQQFEAAGQLSRPLLTSQARVALEARRPALLCINDLTELDTLPSPDAVINLAGAGIADRRWSDSRKETLKSSRIDTTRQLVSWLGGLARKPECLVSASAIGYYGAQGDNEVTDDTNPHPEFTHELCAEWEAEALKAEQHGVRVFLPRIAPVLGRTPENDLAGFLERLVPPFRFGLGGPIGKGEHWMPWIHIDDLCHIILQALIDQRFTGPMIACAPDTQRNREFASTLGHVLHRPAVLPLPPLALKLAFGEMSTLLLTGQHAIPQALQNLDFEFNYPTLEPALEAVLD